MVVTGDPYIESAGEMQLSWNGLSVDGSTSTHRMTGGFKTTTPDTQYRVRYDCRIVTTISFASATRVVNQFSGTITRETTNGATVVRSCGPS